jgi:hypothetical protein
MKINLYGHILILVAFFFSPISNTLIVKLSDLHTMAKRSDIVVHGYVGEKRVVTDNLNRLITLTDVEVIDGFYGAKTGEVITVYQVGGSKNGVIMPLLGGHQYQLGQEIILFGLQLDNAYVSYGAGQGKLDVVAKDGREIILEDLGDVSTVINGQQKTIKPIPLEFEDKNLAIGEIRKMVKSSK